MQHEVRIRIEAPVHTTWSVLSDVESWPEWTTSVRSVNLLDGRLELGAQVRIRQPKFPAVVWRITERISQTGLLGSLVGLVSRRITKRYVALEAAGLKSRSELRVAALRR